LIWNILNSQFAIPDSASSRIAILLAVLATVGCSWARESRARSAIESASFALRRGDVDAAASFVARGLALIPPNSDSEVAWRLRLLNGEVLLNRRDLAAAAKVSEAALPQGPQFRALRARQTFLNARIEYVQGHLPKALATANEALTDVDRGSELALDLGGFVGQVTLQLGRWNDGESQLEAVAARAGAIRNHYIEAMALTSIGMGKFIRNRFDEALPVFERVTLLPGIGETPVYAKALYNAGMCYGRLGQFDRAIALQRRAVAAGEGRPTGADYERALGELGNTYILQGNTREGLTHMQRAFKVANDSNLTNDATLWAKNLAAAYVDLQQWDEAERYNEEAKRLFASTRSGRAVYNTLTTAAIAAGRGQLDQATRLFEEALASPDAPPSVLWDAHFGLANVAIALKQPDRAVREFEATLDIVEQTRAGLLRTDYKLTYLTQLIAFYRAYVDVLVARGQSDRALEIADSSRGRVLAERQGATAPAGVNLAALQRLAKQTRIAFLSYWLAPGGSYLWVVTGDGIRLLTLPPAGEIDTLVRQYQSSIANAMVDPLASRDSAGDRLYRLLIAPVAPSLPPGASVVIIPDGSLHGLNFETLPVDGPRRHYWIEDAQVQIAPSLASFTAATGPTTPASKASRSVLIIGNPAPRPPDFPALRFARNEMTSIATHFGADRVTSYEGDRASPAIYSEARPGRFSYVHFTAHATANLESPLDSAVILSGPDKAYKLYARDVAALPLDADLVTVSACRSAGERAYSGEGLVGFAWAFLRAGARRVVAGLWDVDDRSTADLMDHLYAGLVKDETPAAALRSAKLALIARGGSLASPYAWGAFQLFTVVP
jgi:CHAT domain-containing protein/Tfp pilus assembly protein PilF